MTIKIQNGPKLPEVHGNCYRMMAVAICRENHIQMEDALRLTLVEAYLALGATFGG